MITYIYDPINGVPVRDYAAEMTMIALIAEHAAFPDREITYRGATENTLHALRELVCLNTVPLDAVQIQYDRPESELGPARLIPLKLYANGGIRPWPNGFADTQEGFLITLVRQAKYLQAREEGG